MSNSLPGCSNIPPSNSERKRKWVQWTAEEHRNFEFGLSQIGWGKWKEMSNKYVKTRSPAQITSHAQKYLKRQQKKQRQCVMGTKMPQPQPAADVNSEAATPLDYHVDPHVIHDNAVTGITAEPLAGGQLPGSSQGSEQLRGTVAAVQAEPHREGDLQLPQWVDELLITWVQNEMIRMGDGPWEMTTASTHDTPTV
ncbi:hypothetical protein SAY87_025127 [Trapa incisa]|uniref:Uncharacterized protein n=1 Tax=Trapa incisa TaxID=236973 RepID=A0AAN7GQ83_9MYRT|nr:hypothetical protein SAY87_025127 [Trapa incisa]